MALTDCSPITTGRGGSPWCLAAQWSVFCLSLPFLHSVATTGSLKSGMRLRTRSRIHSDMHAAANFHRRRIHWLHCPRQRLPLRLVFPRLTKDRAALTPIRLHLSGLHRLTRRDLLGNDVRRDLIGWTSWHQDRELRAVAGVIHLRSVLSPRRSNRM